jgi:hypothetical protein
MLKAESKTVRSIKIFGKHGEVDEAVNIHKKK